MQIKIGDKISGKVVEVYVASCPSNSTRTVFDNLDAANEVLVNQSYLHSGSIQIIPNLAFKTDGGEYFGIVSQEQHVLSSAKDFLLQQALECLTPAQQSLLEAHYQGK